MTAVTSVIQGPGDLIAIKAAPRSDELRQIPLSELVESPWNPRKHFDPAKLAEMAESLKKGQLAPIIVRPTRMRLASTTRYEIGAGHRRFRSAPMAGLTSLLAIVRDLDDVAFLELLNIENRQRDDIEPLDEAHGFKLLMEKAGYDVAKLAARIGLSTRYVYDSLTLLKLVPAVRKYLEERTITRAHAILIARLTPGQQLKVMGTPNGIRGQYSHTGGGLFEYEDAGSAGQAELPLKQGVKVRSVRELQSFINDRVRFRPEQNDLPNLFPAAAVAVEQAGKGDELPPVYISYEHSLSQEAKDGKQRTYTKVSWRRADGRQGSKTCEWSRWGIVAAGPYRGDAFRVCVNRDKCDKHFGAAKAKLKRDRARYGMGSSGGAPDTSIKANLKRQQEEDRREVLDAQIAILIKERAPQWANEVMALASQIKMPKQIAEFIAKEQRVVTIGLEEVVDGYDDHATQHAADIFAAMRGRLPGKWTLGYSNTPQPRDEKAAVIALALLFWFMTATKKLDDELTTAADKIVKAAEAAKTKKAEKKPATKKAKKSR
jgi:ParB/RepB/Spo0J family partition protein